MEKFTERPRFAKYETLTGYLYRVAERNGVDFRSIMKYIINENIKANIKVNIRHRYFEQLDIMPRSFVNMEKLSYLLDKNKEIIEDHTFTPVLDKVILDYNIPDTLYRNTLLAKTINTDYRKLCPICIKTDGIYRLLWQVNDIYICNKHRCYLVSICSKCKKHILYCTDNLITQKCQNCGHPYKELGVEYIKKEEVNDQLKIYDDWKCLLDRKFSLVNESNKEKKEKLMANKILYVCEKYSKDKSPISAELKSRLTKKQLGYGDRYQIKLHVLLKAFKELNLGVEQFSKIEVPINYLESKEKDAKMRQMTRYCLTPWCESCGKKDYILPTKKRDPRNYDNICVCTKCYIRFGYNKDKNIWESVNDEINILIRAKSLFSANISLVEIRGILGVGSDRVYKMYGYLLYNKLIDNTNLKMNTQINVSSIISVFKQLMKYSDSMERNSHKLFKWSVLEFYYYLAHKEIQNLLLFQSANLKKNEKSTNSRIKNYNYYYQNLMNAINECFTQRTVITYKQINNMTRFSDTILKKYNIYKYIGEYKKIQLQEQKRWFIDRIKKISDDYLSEQNLKIKVFLVDIFRIAGTSYQFMRKNYPDVTKEIIEKINDYNAKVNNYKYEKLTYEISNAKSLLINNGQNVSENNISKLTGISSSLINTINKLIYYENDKDIIDTR